jgi:hypothetical protein
LDSFDEYMRAEFAPADGFDFPFGDGEGGGSYTDASTGKRYAGGTRRRASPKSTASGFTRVKTGTARAAAA